MHLKIAAILSRPHCVKFQRGNGSPVNLVALKLLNDSLFIVSSINYVTNITDIVRREEYQSTPYIRLVVAAAKPGWMLWIHNPKKSGGVVGSLFCGCAVLISRISGVTEARQRRSATCYMHVYIYFENTAASSIFICFHPELVVMPHAPRVTSSVNGYCALGGKFVLICAAYILVTYCV